MRKIFIIFLIFWATMASAVEIQTIRIKPTLWEKIIICKWHISCYREQFGTTITSIGLTDTVKDALYTTANNNFTALNTGKFELSDWYATTSATQLVGVGTITTGTWNATALSVSKGGTGTTSPTLNYVMLGNGSSGLKVVAGLGTSGQFLTSAGASAPPTWTTSAIDQAGNYNWTGSNVFTSASTTFSSKIGIATTSPYAPLSVAGQIVGAYYTATTSTASQFPYASSTAITVSGTASTTTLYVSGNQIGGSMSYTGSSTGYYCAAGTCTYTGSIPTSANFGIGGWWMEVATNIDTKGDLFLARNGKTTTVILHPNTAGTDSYGYTFTWSGNDLIVAENVDPGGCNVNGTIYWYK